jgi:photosystem II stability/assembly factor-like uncharacterized protein
MRRGPGLYFWSKDSAKRVQIDIEPEAIHSMRLITGTEGFVSSRRSIFWTNDGGSSWTEITPPYLTRSHRIGLVTFESAEKGRAVISSDTTTNTRARLTLAETGDSGKSWRFSQITLSESDALEYSGRVSISFVGPQIGW